MANAPKVDALLKTLNAKKEMLFRRVQILYDYSSKLNDQKTWKNFKIRFQSLDKTEEEFSEIVDRIHCINLDENDEYNPDYAGLDSFTELVGAVRVAYIEHEKTLNLKISNTESQSENVWSDRSLPRIELPKFSGELDTWPVFYEIFKNKIHLNNKLSPDDKIQYLTGKISGQATSVFSGIPATGNNYEIIWNALVDRYQDIRLLANNYMKTIVEFKPIAVESDKNLRQFIDTFDVAVSALQSLDIPDLKEFILAYLAISKLDPQTIKFFELSRVNKTELLTYKEVLEFIKSQAKTLSNANTGTKGHKSNTSSSYVNASSSRTTHAFMVNQSPSKCSICEATPYHAVYRCIKFKKMTPQSRYSIAKEKSLCINCLSSKHKFKTCKSNEKCSVCFAKHHTFLHFEKYSSSQSPSATSGSKVENSTAPSNGETPGNRLVEPELSSADKFVGYSSHRLPSQKSCSMAPKHIVLLSTITVNYFDKFNKAHRLRMLLDSCSQSHFLTSDCALRLGLPISKTYTSVMGIGQTSKPIKGKTTLKISSRFNRNIEYSLECLIINKIIDKSPPIEINIEEFPHLKDLPLADETYYIPTAVDGIIGAELYAHIIGSGKVSGSPSLPVAMQSSLGYVVMGSAPITNPINTQVQVFCSFENSLELLVSKFWEIENIEQGPPTLSQSDEKCEQIFSFTHRRSETGRYVVTLPFKQDPSCLGNSEPIAFRRFLSLERRFKGSPGFFKIYSDAIYDYIAQGHMVEVDRKLDDKNPYYFIPHHGIERVGHPTTPLRVVFDASAKSDTHLSLNDILHKGPKLQPDLVTILLNFRLFAVALTSDIKQMYRQINLVPEHQRFQRVLWRDCPSQSVKTFELTTVSFGVTSSPYLALRVVKQLAHDEVLNFPAAAKFIENSMYVDDICGSVNSLEEAQLLCKELIEMFMAGGLPLVKWSSNIPQVIKYLPTNLRSPNTQSVQFDDNDFQKVLGLEWNAKSDLFSFQINTSCNTCSKRSILSTLARIFDPLGFLAPVTLFAKFLIKDLWKLKIDWDELPPPQFVTSWKLFHEQLSSLSKVQVPRHLNVKENCKCTLVGFADASLKGYACVIYLHVLDQSNKSYINFVLAKSKVSPMKPHTIPRLELMAAVLLSKLIKFVIETYNPRYKINNIFAFSDSQVVLHWINSEPSRWHTFVANRIVQIHDNLPPEHWFFVEGSQNPADCASRGLYPEQFVTHKSWFEGPDWLLDDPQHWPLLDFRAKQLDITGCTEYKSNISTTLVVQQNINPLCPLIDNLSNYFKILKSTVYVLRFGRILPKSSEITPNDLDCAEICLCKKIQEQHFSSEIIQLKQNRDCSKSIRPLRPFLDKDDLIRVGGRLSKSPLNYDAQHPILLPKQDELVLKLIRHYHETNSHSGPHLLLSLIRQKFWILSARTVVRKVTRSCNICFRITPKPRYPLMADLPSARVAINAKCFEHTGCDYAGPFHITLSRHRGVRTQKAYICLYVCLTTKAIHLELASDLSTDKFLEAFNRFLSRRGQVSVVYCDHGTNFIGAKNQLHELYRLIASSEFNEAMKHNLLRNRIQFKFNPPYSPHMGGLWESSVRCVKNLLVKTIGIQILSYEEMTTVLCKIEALLNSRPLCSLSEDPSEPSALTPAHFLNTAPLPYFPSKISLENSENLKMRKHLLDHLVKSYWKRFSLEYLVSLQRRQRWNTSSHPISPGTIVLLMKENVPPLQWPLGIIEKVHPGSDGIVRVASVRTVSGTYMRPTVRLCPLPTQ